MPSHNRAVLASAGSGKTTFVVEEACKKLEERICLVTYTLNGRAELSHKAYAIFGAIPSHVRISTWYAFILQHFIRPYQAHLHSKRVSTINFKRGRSTRYLNKTQDAYYFSSSDKLRLDKVTEFACLLIEKTAGLPIQRFMGICDHLYVDEAQDLSGYDLELMECLLKAGLRITLVGDCRQATYTTNDSPKNKAFRGKNIVKKFEIWEKADLLTIEHQAYSYRCIQSICDFADAFHPEFENTTSRNVTTTDHDGLFAIRESHVGAYRETYHPQPLRYNRKATGIAGHPMNFGAVKGMTFERTIIYPHGPLKKYLVTGKLSDAGKELAKLYVAATRAKQSVAFVVPDNSPNLIVPFYEIAK